MRVEARQDERARAIEILAVAYEQDGFPGVAAWLRTYPHLDNSSYGTSIRAMIAFAEHERAGGPTLNGKMP